MEKLTRRQLLSLSAVVIAASPMLAVTQRIANAAEAPKARSERSSSPCSLLRTSVARLRQEVRKLSAVQGWLRCSMGTLRDIPGQTGCRRWVVQCLGEVGHWQSKIAAGINSISNH